MTMKIKIIFILTILLLCFSCVPNKKHIIIGVSQCSNDNWRMKLNEELKREVYFYDNVEIKICSADDSNETQIAQINKFIEEKVDLLIVAPNEAKSITPVVDKAFEQGIPVILVDRKTASDRYTAFIGADNKAIGRTVGEYIATKLKGKGNVVEIQGLQGSSPATDRHDGFMEALKKHPNIHIVGNGYAGWLQKPAENVMNSILTRTNYIDCVFGQNDRMAMGAYESVKKHCPSKKPMFVGIDALFTPNGGMNAVKNGILSATFIYPTCGDRVIKLAMDILHGKKFQKDNVLYTALVDKDNVRVLSLQSSEISNQDKKLETLHGMVDRYFIQYSNQKVYLVLFITIIVMLFVFVILIYRAFWTKKQLSMLLQKKNDENEQQKNELIKSNEKLKQLSEEVKAVTHAKLVFFTNISHEIRTPLTLIADPIDQLLANKGTTNTQRHFLNLMKKNVNILLRLVNQILEFRKIENGKMDINLTHFDLIRSTQEWMEEFQTSAKKKHIKLAVNTDITGELKIVADKEKMERIFFNLVGNSFKYISSNGNIAVTISRSFKKDSSFVHIEFMDTGTGIKKEDIPYIFDRFYKSNNNKSGTGIGLALTRALVEIQGGEISVKSEYGRGTTFIIEIPMEQKGKINNGIEKSISVEDKTDKCGIVIDAYTAEDAKVNEITDTEDTSSEKSTVLIVDDNNEIRDYVKLLLKENYNVIEAVDGKDGLIKARKYIPDITICDIMMPIMDGLDLCNHLKSEIETSHIPVILLTARSLDDQKIEGYNSGADAYIAKPFNGKLLMARVENLLKNRSILKSVFGDNDELLKENVSDLDKDFITRFRTAVLNRLPDSELNVETLSSDLGLSRVQMYRKVKALTTYSPVELIRITRLKKAHKLIETTDMSISEIAYSVGFTSPSYFTKCFKEYFDKNPNEIMKQKYC